MIGRVLWIGFIAVIAIVTAAVQLDRQARVSPELAGSVPEPFRGFAQVRKAASALGKEDPALAVVEAQTLVERRPIPAAHLRLLAAAQFQAGDAEASSRTIQLAAKRGWRDPFAQEAVLRLALAAGDMPEAARRYAALFLRNETDEAILLEFGPALFNEPKGPARRTMTDIVSGGDRWLGFFLTRGPRVLPADAFAEIVLESKARGAVFECTGIRRVTKQIGKRDAQAADALREGFSGRC